MILEFNNLRQSNMNTLLSIGTRYTIKKARQCVTQLKHLLKWPERFAATAVLRCDHISTLKKAQTERQA